MKFLKHWGFVSFCIVVAIAALISLVALVGFLGWLASLGWPYSAWVVSFLVITLVIAGVSYE